MKIPNSRKVIISVIALFVACSLYAAVPQKSNMLNQFGVWFFQENYSMYKLSQNRDGYWLTRTLLGNTPYFYCAMTNSENQDDIQEMALRENSDQTQNVVENVEDTSELPVGDTYQEPVLPASENQLVKQLREKGTSEYLLRYFYIVDSTTSVKANMFQPKRLLGTDMSIKKKNGKKQILIYHTHGGSEGYLSSEHGKTVEGSLIDVGTTLSDELEQRGYGVYHDTTKYDVINGKIDRSRAYNVAYKSVKEILKTEKDIEVVIDLHRDAAGTRKKGEGVVVNGKKMARVMFFNGLSRNRSGKIKYLKNDNLEGNLAFSLQCKCAGMENYRGLTKPIYLKGYRYNLHMKKRSLLIELGNEYNTLAEAKNSAIAIADMLDQVLNSP